MIELLYRLQELEEGIDSKESALSNARARQRESDELRQARASLEATQANLAELKTRRDRAEWEVADLEAKIKELDERLYSGRVTNPKELTGLNSEIAILRQKKDRAETEALELMEEMGRASSSLSEAQARYNEAQDKWRHDQNELARQIEELEAELRQLRSEREALVLQIAPRDLELYQRVKRYKGRAVALVEQGACGGCRITLSWAKLQQVRGSRPVTCDNCGRLLYMK